MTKKVKVTILITLTAIIPIVMTSQNSILVLLVCDLDTNLTVNKLEIQNSTYIFSTIQRQKEQKAFLQKKTPSKITVGVKIVKNIYKKICELQKY